MYIDYTALKRIDNFVSGIEIRLLSSGTDISSYEWIRKNCRIKGKPWTEKSHEYQRFFLDNNYRVKVCKKCAQIGFSVITILDCFSKLGRYRGFTILYILPSASFSQNFTATRITPLLQECRILRDMQDRSVDSTSVKKFGATNFLHSKGAVSKSAAISIDADALIKDEVDAISDMSILTTFYSRLQHSEYKFDSTFSTPTVPDYGVDKAFSESMRHKHMARCVHCGYSFIPDFSMIVYPGIGKGDELKGLTKRDLMAHDVRLSYMECPHCKVATDESLQDEHRQWVVENPEDTFEAFGMHVQPFSLPNIRPIPQLLKEVPDYYRWADYANNVLGETAADSENAFTEEEFEAYFTNAIPPTDSSLGYMGVDLGMTCHITIIKTDQEGKQYVPEYIAFPLPQLLKVTAEMRKKHNVLTTCYDLYPYTDTILRIQEQDMNAWGCQFTESKILELFTVRMKEENSEKALDRMRVANASRNRGLDFILENTRQGQIRYRECPDKQTFIEHMCSPKRLSSFDKKTGELKFNWVKTDGVDHYMFSTFYAIIAMKLRGVDPGYNMPLPLLISSIKKGKL